MLPISEGWYFYFRTGPSGSVRKPSTKAGERAGHSVRSFPRVEIVTRKDDRSRQGQTEGSTPATRYEQQESDQLAAAESCVRILNKKLKFCEDELATQRENENRRCEEFKAALQEDYETKLRITKSKTL